MAPAYSTPIILILAFVVLLVVVIQRARKRANVKHPHASTSAGTIPPEDPRKKEYK